MPDVLVLDASALCKLIRNEPESESVRAKIKTHLEQGGAVWTEAFASIEVITCARRAVDAGEGTQDALADAVREALNVARPMPRTNDDDMTGLLAVACDTGLTGPDARYIELATGHRLLTFDSKQSKAATKRGIPLA